jgi:hypothetical protein
MKPMRLFIVAVLLSASFPALAQQPQLPPGTTLPKGMPPIPPNAASMTPGQAKAQYDALTPDRKQALKDAAAPYRAQVANDPGMKEKVKAWIKAWMGK